MSGRLIFSSSSSPPPPPEPLAPPTARSSPCIRSVSVNGVVIGGLGDGDSDGVRSGVSGGG